MAIRIQVRDLKSDNYAVRQQAVRLIGKLKAAGRRFLPHILAALKDPHREVRSAAVTSLVEINAPVSDVLSSLLECLRDEDWHVRTAAVIAHADLKPRQQGSILPLLRLLAEDAGGSSYYAKTRAVESLRDFGAVALVDLPEVIELLDSSSFWARCGALTVIGQTAETLADAKLFELLLERLMSAVGDPVASVRHEAVVSIGKLRQRGASAVGVLSAACKDSDSFVAHAAALWLRAVRGE